MPTQGFQLSQFSRAPQVPGNIGVVDTKSIYGSVVDALKSFEAARTAQQVQAATDAELALATQKAATEQALLTPESEARRARANLLASEATAAMPGVDVAAGAKRAADILSRATSDSSLGLVSDRTATEKAKLAAERVLGTVLSDEDLVRRQQQYKSLGTAGAARQRNLDILADPNAAPFARQAAAIALGIEPKAVAPGIGYQVLTDANGNQRLVATNKAAVGAMDVVTGQMVGGVAPGTRPTMAPSQLSLLPNQVQPSAAPAAAPAAPAAPAPAGGAAPLTPTVQAAPRATTDNIWLGQSAGEKATQQDISQVKSEWFKKLPALEAAIRAMETKVVQGEKTLEEAENRLSAFNTGIVGQALRGVGGTPAFDLNELLKPVRTNIFTAELDQMRANSPTGGAVGNVTDVEGNKFESALGSLDIAQSKGQLLDQIENVRNARREVLNNMKKTVEEYRRYLGGFGGQTAAQPTLEERMAAYRNR